MAARITLNDLNNFKTELLDGLRDTFNEGKKVFDSSGNELHLTGNRAERNAYYDALFEQKKEDRLAEIEKQMSAIKGNSGLAAQKLKELAEEKERVQNGGISKNDERQYRNQQIAKTVGAIAAIGNGIINIVTAFGEKRLALARTNVELHSKTLQINLEKQNKILSAGMENITSGFTKNAHEMAYAMTQNSYGLAKTTAKATMDNKIAQIQFRKSTLEANVNFQKSMVGAGAVIGAAVGSIIPGVGTAVGVAVGAIVGAVGGLVANAISKIGGLELKKLELQKYIAEATSANIQQTMDSFENITKSWNDLYKSTSDFILKFQEVSRKFSVTIGFTNNTLARTMLDMSRQKVTPNNNLVRIFGEEVDKIPEYMASYISASGRAVGMNAKDAGNLMATGRLFGMSGTESASLYGSMNIFNTSISSASDSMSVMYHQITRMGLSTKKFGKDLVNNLKLAQKYNFKGGVDNMMKLTKWAQQTRFNLNSAASFADSILDSTLSDALEKSAKLQVLGGAAAIYSDPLGMLYDAGANVGDLARRQAAMFSDISGTFNAKTGETEFSWYENKMIRERAKAAGLNVEDVFNQIRQTNKQGVIDKLLSGMDEEDRIAIGNRATYNKKKNRWEVTDIKGNVHDIQEYKDNKAKIDDLLPKDTQEAMLVVAEKSLSELEKLNYAVEDNKRKLGIEEYDNIMQTVQYERNEMDNFYKQHMSEIKNGFEAAMNYNKDMFQANLKIMEKTGSDVSLLNNIYGGLLNLTTELLTNTKNFNYLKNAAAYMSQYGSEGLHNYILANTAAGTPEGGNALNWIQKNPLTSNNNSNSGSNSIDFSARNINLDPIPTDRNGMTNTTARSYRTDADGNVYEVTTWTSAGNDTVFTSSSQRQLRPDEVEAILQSGDMGKLGTTTRRNGTPYDIQLNDGIISSNGAVRVRTNPNDQYLAAMPNGPIDKILNQLIPGLQSLLNGNGGSNNVNLNLNGRLELSQDGSSVNLVELIKNDPAMATKFLAVLQKTMEVNQNGRAIRNRMIS